MIIDHGYVVQICCYFKSKSIHVPHFTYISNLSYENSIIICNVIPDRKPKLDPHGLDVGKWAQVHPLGAQVRPTR